MPLQPKMINVIMARVDRIVIALEKIAAKAEQTTYPHQDGDILVLGPEIFLSENGRTICYKGENFNKT